MNIVIEPLPPLEPKKEMVNSQKNIFGSKGELLLGIDEDLYSEVAGEPSEAKKLRRKQNLISLEEPEVEAITIDDDMECELDPPESQQAENEQSKIEEDDDDLSIVGDNMSGFSNKSID